MKKSDLKTLTAEWDRKLAESGFEDIEDRKTGLLKSWSGSTLQELRVTGRFGCVGSNPSAKKAPFSNSMVASKGEYYRIAQQRLHDTKFRDGFDRKVWAVHASGGTLLDVASKLDISKELAQYHVDRLRHSILGLNMGRFRNKGRK